VDLESFRIEKKYESSISLNPVDGELKPISIDIGKPPVEEPTDFLSNIIKVLNDHYGSDLKEEDKVNLKKIQTKLEKNEELRMVHLGDNTESNKRFVFNQMFDNLLQELVDDRLEFYKKFTEPTRNQYVKRVMYENYSSQVYNTPTPM